jgi:hypothetical protein
MPSRLRCKRGIRISIVRISMATRMRLDRASKTGAATGRRSGSPARYVPGNWHPVCELWVIVVVEHLTSCGGYPESAGYDFEGTAIGVS